MRTSASCSDSALKLGVSPSTSRARRTLDQSPAAVCRTSPAFRMPRPGAAASSLYLNAASSVMLARLGRGTALTDVAYPSGAAR
eukprot:scaffold10050_cov53-Phaeocystis_antarctica.AAC.1